MNKFKVGDKIRYNGDIGVIQYLNNSTAYCLFDWGCKNVWFEHLKEI